MADARVLLVDDEADFVEALSGRLEVRGLAVDAAADGTTAIQKVHENKYDAIILDLAMPGMDGIETLRAMRNLNPDVQVILLTGRGTVRKSIEAMKLGAMDFLEKPVELDVLLDKIRQAKSAGDEIAGHKTEQIINEIMRTKGW
jgi:DNA-binding NtrC family response regulator